MQKIICLCAVAIVSFALQICHAADCVASIAEISGFSLVVENIPSTLKALGMTETDIQERVEFICRKNSLPIKSSRSSTDPFLVVGIAALPVRVNGREIGFTYLAEMKLHQAGKTYVKGTPTFMISWVGRTQLAISSRDSLRSDINTTLQERVEEFANVWLASHEK